jgi:integrase
MPFLSESQIRAAKPADKAYKLYDERGLYLKVETSGSRLWRFKYRLGGKERLLALGAYPDVPLKRAREKRDEARRLLADGVDPSAHRQEAKAAEAVTFAGVAAEWLDLHRKRFAPATFEKAAWTFNDLVNPFIGSRPIASITAPELLAVVRRLEKRGKHETAHRTKQRCGQVFRYAIATGRATRDVSADLRGALAPVVTKNHAAIVEPRRIGGLLRAIDSYVGHPPTQAALKLAPLVFLRPGELRKAEWSEIDLEGAEWRIPASRMKMREQHIVPLAKQAIAIVRELHTVTGRGRYVFPSPRSADRPMSENAVTAALRRMGYSGEEMTWHGFRSLASTSLNEQGWHPDLIELQLAHAERNEVRSAYNRAQRLAERRRMMQQWADYLDTLRASIQGTTERTA